MLRGLIFASCLVAGAGVALAYEQKETDTQICPDRLAAGTDSMLCSCPSEATANGSVWGSDPYTDDSAICRSALHAGAIGTEGGLVFVVEAPGRPSYPASTRNSVASGAWTSAWGRSIAFRPTYEARDVDRQAMAQDCPANAGGLDVGARLQCGCAAEAAASGSVWGSGPYTGDSAICRAAVHAGAIGGEGGMVRVRVTAGRDGYSASARNGVGANSWGSYAKSFEFDR
jgi:hypothetical protein